MNYTNYRNIILDLHIGIYQLYDNYMKIWNSKNSDTFDNDIREFRTYMRNNYLSDHIDYLNNIPTPFKDTNSGYWATIIMTSNRYVPDIENHTRCAAEERYIMSMMPSIEEYLNKMHTDDRKAFLKSSGSKTARSMIFGRPSPGEAKNKIIGKLDILILAYHIRDNIIVVLDLLNNFLKVKSIDEYNALIEMNRDTLQNVKEDMYNVKKVVNNFDTEEYKDLNAIYKCFFNIIYLFNTLQETPSIHSIDDYMKMYQYCLNIKNDSNLQNIIRFINVAKRQSQSKKQLANLMANPSNNYKLLESANQQNCLIYRELDNQFDIISKLDLPKTPSLSSSTSSLLLSGLSSSSSSSSSSKQSLSSSTPADVMKLKLDFSRLSK